MSEEVTKPAVVNETTKSYQRRIKFSQKNEDTYLVELVDKDYGNTLQEMYEIVCYVEARKHVSKTKCPCSIPCAILLTIWFISIVAIGGVAICLYFSNV